MPAECTLLGADAIDGTSLQVTVGGAWWSPLIGDATAYSYLSAPTQDFGTDFATHIEPQSNPITINSNSATFYVGGTLVIPDYPILRENYGGYRLSAPYPLNLSF